MTTTSAGASAVVTAAGRTASIAVKRVPRRVWDPPFDGCAAASYGMGNAATSNVARSHDRPGPNTGEYGR